MFEWAKKHDLLIATGGDMFGPAYTGAQAANITALVELMGWDPVFALKTATSNAGEILSWSGQMNPYKYGKIGTVEGGSYADLIIVNGNPLENVKLIEDYTSNFKIIMKDGVIYKNTL